jgi:hypothetical protein
MRIRLAEALLVITAILLTVLGTEAAFSLVGLRYVPLRLQDDLPEGVRVFAQSSKAGVVPRDPVVLLGDSYAQGYGDWLLQADPNRNGAFHSAHVINKLTGRDVVSLGKSGAGSPEGMALFPAIAYAYAKRAWYLRLPPPHVAVVYFYEGNDLNNNLRFLAQRPDESGPADSVERIDRAIAAYPSVFPIAEGWRQHFPFLLFLDHVARRSFAEWAAAGPGQGLEPGGPPSVVPGDPPNLVAVAGEAKELPSNLQSPALELTEPEFARAGLVFERSLAFLRKLLPGTPVLVVYLPSPLSSYQLLSAEVSIQPYMTDRATRHPRERVAEYSDRMCRLIQAASAGLGAGFLDLRPAIRAAGARDVLHGPVDFKHFNRIGNETMGEAVAERISASPAREGTQLCVHDVGAWNPGDGLAANPASL